VTCSPSSRLGGEGIEALSAGGARRRPQHASADQPRAGHSEDPGPAGPKAGARDPAGGAVFDVSDNDELWTALYFAAMSLRFGATKDPAAREQGRRSMNALLDLELLSGIPGFPARAMVTDDELRAGVRGFNPEARVHARGESARAWYRSPTTSGLWCKGIPAATSSTATISPGISTITSSPTPLRRRRSWPWFAA
jgi:hypothetical protein